MITQTDGTGKSWTEIDTYYHIKSYSVVGANPCGRPQKGCPYVLNLIL
jgi:hypothetical protein